MKIKVFQCYSSLQYSATSTKYVFRLIARMGFGQKQFPFTTFDVGSVKVAEKVRNQLIKTYLVLTCLTHFNLTSVCISYENT